MLTAGAELARDKDVAQRLGARAQALYGELTGNATHSGDRRFRLGGDTLPKGRWPTPPRVSNNA